MNISITRYESMNKQIYEKLHDANKCNYTPITVGNHFFHCVCFDSEFICASSENTTYTLSHSLSVYWSLCGSLSVSASLSVSLSVSLSRSSLLFLSLSACWEWKMLRVGAHFSESVFISFVCLFVYLVIYQCSCILCCSLKRFSSEAVTAGLGMQSCRLRGVGLDKCTSPHGVKLCLTVNCSLEDCNYQLEKWSVITIMSASRMNTGVLVFLDSADKVSMVVEQVIMIQDTWCHWLIQPKR